MKYKPGAKRYTLDRFDEDTCGACHGDLETYGWYSTINREAFDGGYCSEACAEAAAIKRCAELNRKATP
jgi:hypothetical protein